MVVWDQSYGPGLPITRGMVVSKYASKGSKARSACLSNNVRSWFTNAAYCAETGGIERQSASNPQPSGRTERATGVVSVRGSRGALNMRVDEGIHRDAGGPRGAVLVMAFEIHGLLAPRDASPLRQHETRDGVRVRRPGVEYDAVALLTVFK